MNRIAEISTIETSMFSRMSEVSAQRAGTVKKQVSAAIASRLAFENLPENQFNGSASKDCKNLDLLTTDSVARFFVACGVAPEYYINSVAYDAETFESKSKVPSEAKTRNLKAYKKFAETAEYFASGAKLESVFKTIVACMIVSSQYQTVIPRDVVERFLSSVPLSHVSEELAEAVEQYRDKTMTGGAQTQTSQCTLQLANMRSATVVRNGRNKDFALDVHSPVIVSFAQKFGLVAQLERAQQYRAAIDADHAETASAE